LRAETHEPSESPMFVFLRSCVTNLPSVPALPFRGIATAAFVEASESVGAYSQPNVISTKLVLTYRKMPLQVFSRTGTCPKTLWLQLGQICVLRFVVLQRIILTVAPSVWSTQ
jgi:hypothetical protein